MKLQSKTTKLIHCLHGHRLPIYSMTGGATTWVTPDIRFTMSLIETDESYAYGISVLLDKKDMYSRKRGRDVSIGRAEIRPFLTIKKTDFTKDQAVELMYNAGYKISTSPHRLVKRWTFQHTYDPETADSLFLSLRVGDKTYVPSSIDTRMVTFHYNQNKMTGGF